MLCVHTYERINDRLHLFIILTKRKKKKQIIIIINREPVFYVYDVWYFFLFIINIA